MLIFTMSHKPEVLIGEKKINNQKIACFELKRISVLYCNKK